MTSTAFWIGRLGEAPRSVTARLRRSPSFVRLEACGLNSSETLVYAPPLDGDTDVLILGRLFTWEPHARPVWLFSTIGLCGIEQQIPPGRRAFRHFELVLATNNSGVSDPFPAKLGDVLSHPQGDFPGWEWNRIEQLPLLEWFVWAGREIANLVRSGSILALWDTLDFGPGREPWTRSVLDHSVILPATVHMLLLGHTPFNRPLDPTDTVQPSDWLAAPGTGKYDYGFCWLLPVSASEHAKASSEGTEKLFCDLIDLADGADDACVVAFDLLRGSPDV